VKIARTRTERNALGANAMRIGASHADKGNHIGAAVMAIAASVLFASSKKDSLKVLKLTRELNARAEHLHAYRRTAQRRRIASHANTTRR
jgi:hypothetical protein